MTIPSNMSGSGSTAFPFPAQAYGPQMLETPRYRNASNTASILENVSLQEARQSGRVSSALLSSLMGPGERFFPAPSPQGLAPAEPSAAQHPDAALLETLQSGKVSSALFSSLMGPGDRFFPAPVLSVATGMAGPGIQDKRLARDAYVLEAQAQRQAEQRALMGTDFGHEWFA